MFKIEPVHLDLVIVQMLRSPAVAEMAIKHLDGAHLVAQGVGGRPIHAVMFEVIKRYITQFGHLPDMATVRVEVGVYLEKYYPEPGVQKQLCDELKFLLELQPGSDTRGEDLARYVIQHIVKVQVYEPAARSAIDEAASSGQFNLLAARLQELNGQQTGLNGGKSIDKVLSVDLRQRGERMLTHVSWIDQRLGRGRGPVVGCTMVLIMPQGVGKTSLGMNLCINQALAGKDALLVLAEEGLSASVQQKIKGCALGVDYGLFDTMTDAEVFAHCKLSPILSVQKLQKIETHLRVLDLSSGVGGVDEIVAEIASLEARKRKPVFVYVDWAGFIVNRLTAVTSGKVTKEAALKSLSYALAEAAVRFNNIICIAQQMSGVAVERGPTGMNDQYCAEDCKGFTQPAKYVIVVNPHSEQGDIRVNVCNIAKARDDAKPDRFVVRLKGEMSTFVDVSTDFEIKKKAISDKRKNRRAADSGATVSS